MGTEQVLALVEDVLQQHGNRPREIDFASRKAEEASSRRYEAAGWLRKIVGVVGGKDLPAEPSEEEFRLGLRSGIILCNVLNKVKPEAITKVVEGPYDSVIIPDGAALSAFQYFENVRNFLVAAEEMGLPIFEASDLEQGGKAARIVNCVLALKSFSDWQQGGGTGSWKFGGNVKPPASNASKQFVRKNSEPFMNSISRTISLGEKMDSFTGEQSSLDDLCHDLNDGAPRSLNLLVRGVLANKKQEEIPILLESMLSRIMEEFERRLSTKNEVIKPTPKDKEESNPQLSLLRTSSIDSNQMEEELTVQLNKEECSNQMHGYKEEENKRVLKMQMLVEQQESDIKMLKSTMHSTKAGMQYLQTRYQDEFNGLGKQLRALAQAASGYQKVLEENRKLYNQVQDLKGNIRVYCRVRPFLQGKTNCLSTVEHIHEGNITIATPVKYVKDGRKSFTFNKVFGPSASQEEVFSDTQPLVRSVLDGYNVCIFAYGQTGSGKTFTMSGPNELTEESVGVNYRALSYLFLLSHQRRDIISYDISVQMLEIYNEQVRDLLVTDGLNKRLEIRNSSQNRINVPDANLVPVSSTSDVINLMNVGQRNRAVSATAMNDRSSRSHSCLTVHVQGRDLTSGNVLHGCMHLVDLAGSERVDKSEVTGDRLKEALHINKSLSALGDVISSLAQKNSHVPYRNSKLTQLLQDSLGGQAKTLMFVHISPETDAIGETISTLKFAERASTVELGAARVNKDGAEVKELKEQIASLKGALAKTEGESEHFQKLQFSSPERFAVKPADHNWHGSGNIEGRKNSSLKPRRRSLDLQEMMNSPPPPWPRVSSPAYSVKDDDRESASSGDWIDKVMVNKLDGLSRTENTVGHWEMMENRQFYQNSLLDSSKMIYPDQMYSKKDPNETTSTDDELDAATSDCSEADYILQSNLPRASSLPNGSVPKIKKSHLIRIPKVTETRSLIPSLIPQPSRKLANGMIHKTGSKQVQTDGKKKTGNGNVKGS